MKYKEASSLIWNVCDNVLRGLFKTQEYGDIISPFITLRRLDFILERHKDNVVMNPKILPMLTDVMFTDYIKQKGL